MATKQIHRAGLNGRPACGAAQGFVSMYGVKVSCPHCMPRDADEVRLQQLAAIAQAASTFRARTERH